MKIRARRWPIDVGRGGTIKYIPGMFEMEAEDENGETWDWVGGRVSLNDLPPLADPRWRKRVTGD